ncbi:MAG: glutamine synthetase III [Candidatus Krumholzibacteriia bacterium]
MQFPSSPRAWAIQEVLRRQVRTLPHLQVSGSQPISAIYGENTFGSRAMQEKLPKTVYEKLQETIRRGQPLDRSIADVVAHAVKEWAIEKQTTHFCHWFQPMTGLTAEKHDSFLTFGEHGVPIESFSGTQLIQSEPDASSFPSGGMRTTFEARGYTAWDPSSPIFIMDGPNGRTLCIPSVFISYHGEALDKKTPLLRSMRALNESALKMLQLFGNTSAVRVAPTVGPEQEYFLVDRAFQALRPDLLSCGRTLLGARAPKGQQLEDHYFGSIRNRVQAFMQEAEHELYKLGIPVKTRHNEVAPSQFECAPIFEEANVAADHNQIVMEVMRQVARRHAFALLLHEKPFDGINGSGKHNNWSLMDSDGRNLLDPGKSPRENLRFLVFLMAVLRAVHRRAGLLRASIASSGNDHRLGANEAPPAIISVYLGDQLTGILDAIEHGVDKQRETEERMIHLGLSNLPDVDQDYTDRNRTSPFAFTGNKFEFRGVGSSASIAHPITILNAAVAESLDELHVRIEARRETGVTLEQAMLETVRGVISETKVIRFEGNNYAPEWIEEAARRGLPNLARTPEALEQLVLPESIELFTRTGAFTEGEVQARYQIHLERYLKDIDIEVETLVDLARTHVLPAAMQHQANLAQSIDAVSRVKGQAPPEQMTLLDTCTAEIGRLQERLETLDQLVRSLADTDERSRAPHYASDVAAAMHGVRESCDSLELIVADALWPLPKYPEMLFLS